MSGPLVGYEAQDLHKARLKNRLLFCAIIFAGFWLLLLAAWGISAWLHSYGLAFRQWIEIVSFGLLFLSFLLFCGGLIAVLAELFSARRKTAAGEVVQKTACTLSILILVGFMGVVSFYSLVLSAFGYNPETVTEINRIKLIAVDTSYLDQSMEYYAYENAFVRGGNLVGRCVRYNYEWYEKELLDKMAGSEFAPGGQ